MFLRGSSVRLRLWKTHAPGRRANLTFQVPSTNINPFARIQWQAKPFLAKNMPQLHPNAAPHKSLMALTVTNTPEGTWHIIDGRNQSVGVLASHIVRVLTGKSRVDWVPHTVAKVNFIVVNGIHLHFRGSTWDTKIYRFSRGTDGRGSKELTAKSVFVRNPGWILNHAVRGMMPRNRLRNIHYKRIYVYGSALHPHPGLPQVVVPAEPRPEAAADDPGFGAVTMLYCETPKTEPFRVRRAAQESE